jgi:hypothetical protein
MTTAFDLMRKTEQEAMAWVATASLDDLRRMQSAPINSFILAAIQARVAHLEDAQRSRRILIVAVLTLVAATAAVVVGVVALVTAR